MTLANAGFNRDEDTTGTTLATHSVNSKDHPVVMNAGPSGHLIGTIPTFSWWVPGTVLTSANKHFCDIYNSSASTQTVEVRGLWAIPKTDVASAGVVSAEVLLIRTTAAGSAGTANLFNSGSTSSTSHIITPMNTTDSYSTANITARFLPTSGTPSSGVLYWANYVFAEETNAAAYYSALTNLLPVEIDARRMTLHPGQGLLIKQGTVATSGSLGFLAALAIY
jgi:hypothetical protein